MPPQRSRYGLTADVRNDHTRCSVCTYKTSVGIHVPGRFWGRSLDFPGGGIQSERRDRIKARSVIYSELKGLPTQKGVSTMNKLIAVAVFALAVVTSAQAETPAPAPQLDGLITQVAFGCGPFRTRVAGVCVARTTIRQNRRCMRWTGHICARWL
jgi:hypothetical protein